MSSRPVIGIFGGTFDPVHCGHINLALELQQHLPFTQMRLLPCRSPTHRDPPVASVVDRVAMLRLAIKNTSLLIDETELQRAGPSYTIDTLQTLRKELGPDQSLVLCMGADAFATLPGWHQWQLFLTLAHLVVMTRPGISNDWPLTLQSLLVERQVNDPIHLQQSASGRIYLAQLSQIPLSSTRVRQSLATGQLISHAVPPNVQHYIEEKGLYRHS